MKLYEDIQHESQLLCSDKNPTLLKKCNAEDLIELSNEKIVAEIKSLAPVLYGCLHEVTCSKQKQKRELMTGKSTNIVEAIAIASSILLRWRCERMSALAYRFSIGVLWHNGTKKQVQYNTTYIQH